MRPIFKILIILFIIVLIGIAGGYFYLTHTKTTIEAVREENGTTGSIAPFGDLPPIKETVDERPNNLNPIIGDVPKLRKISATPVAGADVFNRKEGFVTKAYIRYVDRGTGNIYETPTSSLATNRVTNTTIPKVAEAKFGVGGNSVIMRYTDSVDNIETFVARVSASSSDLTGNFSALNSSPLILSPSKNRFFYMVRTATGEVGYISDFSNKATQIFTHPLTQWLAFWPNETSIVLTTKPTSIAGGVAYQQNVAGGGLVKLIGPKNGLVVLPSPKIDSLIFSETRNNTLLTGLHDVKTSQERAVPYPTIPDKCVFGLIKQMIYCGTPKFVPSGEYPDVWYQGIVSFNDKITSIDANALALSTVIDLSSVSGEEIDATDLHLSPDENYLIFTNKKDLSLWGLRLN